MNDFHKIESTECQGAEGESFLIGRDAICAAQCGLKRWCTAFTLTAEVNNGDEAKRCKMYTRCEPKDGVMGTDLFRLQPR